MSSIHRDDRPALVVVTLAFVVLLVGWLFEAGGRHQSCFQVASPASHSENQQYNGQAEYSEVCSTDYQVFGDTIAQWLMAFFAIAATLVSWRAVVLVRETYKETKRTADAAVDSNNTAREIGRAQVRAYVSWAGAHMAPRHPSLEQVSKVVGFSFVPVAKNTGQSPATLTALFADILVLDPGEQPETVFDLPTAACNNDIGAGNDFNFRRQRITLTQAESAIKGEKVCYLIGWGAYTDVFQAKGDLPHVTDFCFEVQFTTYPALLTTSELMHANILLQSISEYSIRPA